MSNFSKYKLRSRLILPSFFFYRILIAKSCVKYVHSFLLRYNKRRTTTYDVMKYRDRASIALSCIFKTYPVFESVVIYMDSNHIALFCNII